MSEHEHRDLPSKLFFRIGEVAGLVGVEPHVLRYWEREFRSIRPTKSAKGQRVYSRKDVENLLRVRDLLYRDGFTIAGAKKKLQRGGPPDGSADEATEIPPTASAPYTRAPDMRASEARALDLAVPEGPAARLEHELEARADVRVAEPASANVHTKLEALRAEVVAFLAELPDEDG